jgi:hypothetical protein
MINKNNSGQGIIEAIFAIGLLGLIMTGAAIAVITTISNRNVSFDRRKAVELASLVTEQLISQSKDSAGTFWQLTSVSGQEWPVGYDGYTFSVGFTNIYNLVKYPNCGVGKTDCAEVVIGIGWSGKDPKTTYFNRFFSKNDN